MKKTAAPLILCILLAYACKKDATIDLQTSETIGVDRIDTFTINSFTLSLDSLPTNSQNVLLVGNIKDNATGITSSNAYTQIDLPSYSDIDSKSTYDSINMVLYYNRYSYGDTLKNSTIHVHQLNSNIALKEIPQYLDLDEQPIFVTSSALYNTSTFAYDNAEIGSATFRPLPHRRDSVIIKLADTMGETWFNLIKNKDERFTDATKFLEYFKGVALVPDDANTNILGFVGDSLKINLNYSYYNTSGLKTKGVIPFLSNSSLQHNNITGNRSATVYSQVKNRKTVIPATATNNQTVIQSGTGVVTRLSIPGLQDFLEQNTYAINNAELRIPISKNSDKTISPPDRLVMMLGTKNNTPTYLVPDFTSTATQYAYLNKESGDIDKYYYAFNLTNEITKINTSQKVGETILLSYPTDKLFNSAEQVIINNNKNTTDRIKLIITYSKF